MLAAWNVLHETKMVDRLPMTNAAGQFLFMVKLEQCEQSQDAIPKAVGTTFTKQICY